MAVRRHLPTQPKFDTMHPYDRFMSTAKLHAPSAVNFTTTQMEMVRAVYYAMGSQVDDWIGELLDAMYARKDGNKWYVIYTSDHGEMAMEHMQTHKNALYEGSVRVPLIIAPPLSMSGVIRGGVDHSVVSHLDIFPTLVDIAKGGHLSFLTGTSLLPFLEISTTRRALPRREHAVSQYHAGFSDTGAFMVRHGAYKLIVFGQYLLDEAYRPQVFNVDRDPEEITDIFATDEGHHVYRKLSKLLASDIDFRAVDKHVKVWQRDMYRKYMWTPEFEHGACSRALGRVFQFFDSSDAGMIAQWSRLPCA